jgi:poly(3-hydroxybutyrate) depolymerase
MKRVLLLFVMIAFGNFIAQARVIDVSVPPGNNYETADFRLWYPADVKRIRGIVVLMLGSNGDGRNMVGEPFWQAFARRYRFALVGGYITDHPHDNMAIEQYVNVKEGSGNALLRALSIFASRSRHAELAEAPLLLWGMSAGGEFNYEMACWKPDRIIAFVVNKGGVYYTALASKQARAVPGILFTGQDDLQSRVSIIRGLYAMNRRFGAVWTFAEEPGVAHVVGNSRQLAARFFSAVLLMRLPVDWTGNGPVALQNISEESTYVGNATAHTYSPYSKPGEDGYSLSWLPTKSFALAWSSFIQGRRF